MGFALLAAVWLSVRVGVGVELGLTVSYAVVAFGALGLSLWPLDIPETRPLFPSVRGRVLTSARRPRAGTAPLPD
jgi:hypothetical protein